MQERIRQILADHGRMATDPCTLEADDDLYEMGLTSHALVSVMLALEDEFDVEFPDTMLRKSTFASVGDIERAVLELQVQMA